MENKERVEDVMTAVFALLLHAKLPMRLDIQQVALVENKDIGLNRYQVMVVGDGNFDMARVLIGKKFMDDTIVGALIKLHEWLLWKEQEPK